MVKSAKVQPRVGVLGCGNMGGALLRGIISSGAVSASQITAFDVHQPLLETIQKELGVKAASSALDAVQWSDIVILAVKPQVFSSMAGDFKSHPPDSEKILVSVMAGITSASLKSVFAKPWKTIRVMPNLPLSVGEGATAIETDTHSETDLALVEKLFGTVGRTVRVLANQMDAATGLSGSGPMYVFEFIEGLILAGIKSGLTRSVAADLALQTVKGAVKLLESGPDSPSEWSSRVCSPGGSTIHGLHVLEQAGFKGTLMRAVEAAVSRSKQLAEQG